MSWGLRLSFEVHERRRLNSIRTLCGKRRRWAYCVGDEVPLSGRLAGFRFTKATCKRCLEMRECGAAVHEP